MSTVYALLLNCAYSGVIFGCIMAFRAIFRRKVAPGLMVALWFVFLAKLVVPITLEVPFHFFTVPKTANASVSNEAAPPGNGDSASGITTSEMDSGNLGPKTTFQKDPSQNPPASALLQNGTSSNSLSSEWKAEQWIIAVLTIGTALSILRLGRQMYRLRRLVGRGGQDVSEQTVAVLDVEKRRLGITGRVDLRTIQGLESPALTMTPRPTILLPVQTADLSDQALAIRHELVHYRRGDRLLMLAAACLKAVWWFNPFVYRALREMREDMEAACDASVVHGFTPEQKAHYARMLIAMAKSNGQTMPGLVSMSPASRVERRIRSIFGRYRSGRSARTAAVVLVAVMSLACFTTACQPTPSEYAVGQKTGSGLFGQDAGNVQQTGLDPWSEDLSYPTGQVLHVDVIPENYGGNNVPSASVVAAPFSADSAKAIADALFPGKRMTASVRTKQQIKAEMQALEEMLQRERQEPGSVSADDVPLISANLPATDEEWEAYSAMSSAEKIRFAMEGLETELASAPDESDVEETDYTFTKASDSSQHLNIVSSGDDAAELSFVNSDEFGSSELIYRLLQQPADVAHWTYRCIKPSLLESDAEYDSALETAQDFVSKLATGPVMLQHVSCGTADGDDSRQYEFSFVPVVSGYPQTVPNNFVGTQSVEDGAEHIALSKPEEIWIRVRNGQVTRADWVSPSQVTVENENAAVISFEQARDIALRQFDRMLVEGADNQLTMGGDELTLTDVQLNLTKVLAADEYTYRLVPSWTFSGWQSDDRLAVGMDNTTQMGEIMAFVTVDATDGSIIDRGAMY